MKSVLLFTLLSAISPILHECSRSNRGKQLGKVAVPEFDGPGSIAAFALLIGVAALIFNRYRN